MPHVNQMVVGPFHWRRDGKTAEEVIAENPVGKVASDNRTPFTYKIIESGAIPQNDGMFEILWVVEPASPEETEKYREWAYDSGDPEDQASQARWWLWQKSWYSGIPADATIFCAACQKARPAHGANHFDDTLVCNACVGKIERAIACRKISDPQEWIAETAEVSKIHNFIDEAEKIGEGCIQLGGMRRYIEVVVLYEFIANSRYRGDAIIEDWYPYKDVVPMAYKGYLREDWEPGEYFTPGATIFFTDRNKLLVFLMTGELPGAKTAAEEIEGSLVEEENDE